MKMENEWISRCKNRGHGDHHKEKRKQMDYRAKNGGLGDQPKEKRKQMD